MYASKQIKNIVEECTNIIGEIFINRLAIGRWTIMMRKGLRTVPLDTNKKN